MSLYLKLYNVSCQFIGVVRIMQLESAIPTIINSIYQKMGNYRAAIRDRLSNYGCIKKALTTCKCNDRFVEYIYTTYLRPAGLDWRIRNAHEANEAKNKALRSLFIIKSSESLTFSYMIKWQSLLSGSDKDHKLYDIFVKVKDWINYYETIYK